jgi:hypothetical protein
MDERRLNQLRRETAETVEQAAPPATVDHADVLAGFRRARERARRRQTVAVAVAALVVAGAGLFSAGLLSTSAPGANTLAERTPSASAAPAPGALPGQPGDGGLPENGQRQVPFEAQKRVTPSSCSEPDLALFGQLTAALPALRGATPRPLSDAVSCPEGGRGVEVDVVEDGARGVLRVLLSPSGGGMSVTSSGGSVISTSTSTQNGGTLSVSVISAGSGRAPYEGQVDQLADTLAAQN